MENLIFRVPIGVRFMMVSALGFALMAACVKLVAIQGIPLLEIVAARSLVSLTISYVDVRRKGISPWTHRTKSLKNQPGTGIQDDPEYAILKIC